MCKQLTCQYWQLNVLQLTRHKIHSLARQCYFMNMDTAVSAIVALLQSHHVSEPSQRSSYRVRSVSHMHLRHIIWPQQGKQPV